MFSPLVLERLADLPTKAKPGETMTLADLFTWTQDSVFGDIENGRPSSSDVHHNLQRRYARLLGKMATTPAAGTPYDAQALARHELVALHGQIQTALARKSDLETQAHLEALDTDVTRALEAKVVIPAS